MSTRSTRAEPREPASRCRGDEGASLVEYALLLALIVVACIGAVTFLGGNLSGNISRSSSSIVTAGQ
jgi:Flp pilus assembly pilin Flp